MHDVGKLAVPDALLTKPGTLTERERIQMSEHVELSARIVGSILSEEQVAWIRGHHERPDGLGYPAGMTEYEISDGAGLLALADAWDVMIAGRTYSRQQDRARRRSRNVSSWPASSSRSAPCVLSRRCVSAASSSRLGARAGVAGSGAARCDCPR